MPLSEEQEELILQDFIAILKARYGEEWNTKLTSNIRPSPIQQIAEQRGVKVSYVRKVRSKLLSAGQFIQIWNIISSIEGE